MCIVTRNEGSEDVLIRFARSPDGVVVPDLGTKLPGRGVWVTCSAKTVGEAVKKQAFARGFEEACSVPEGLVEQVGVLLRKQAVSHLALARKAGVAVQGFTKVEEAMRKSRIRVLLHAQVAGADGVSKLDRLSGPDTVISNSFLPDEMDLAFGRPNVIHAAVTAGGLADRLVVQLQRLTSFEDVGAEHLKGQKKII
jgi:uncharacterized protein